ncbi:hypothetical protein N6N92_24680, partial [Escherichia coli]|nr:hypothetical protein [Escherichia coli]
LHPFRCNKLTHRANKQTVADPVSRIIVNHLPVTADFRLTQQGCHLDLQGECQAFELKQCQRSLEDYFIRQNVAIDQLTWTLRVD